MVSLKKFIIPFFAAALIIHGCAHPAAEDAKKASSGLTPSPAAGDQKESITDTEIDGSIPFAKQMYDTPIIFAGNCVKTGMADERGNTDSEFLIKTVYRGDAEAGSTAIVRLKSWFSPLEAGTEYIIFASPCASVYEDKPLIYIVNDQVANGQEYTGNVLEFLSLSYQQIEEMITSRAADYPYNGIKKVAHAYCTSNELADICEYADCAAELRVDAIDENSFSDITVYTCSTLKALKGYVAPKIHVAAFKDSLIVGESYTLLLMRDYLCEFSSGNYCYTLAASNSIFKSDTLDARSIEEIYQVNK